jgi:beta-lactamase superfamily II metal-dependent hydrolase
MARRRNKKLTRFQWCVIAIFAVFAVLMTLNESMEQPLFPQWDTWFEQADLTDTATPLPDSTLQVTVIDVGNADAILLQNKGQSMLIDAGERGDGDDVLAYLKKQNVSSLDHVIATHADSDHIGGMATVLNEMPVKEYIMAFMPKGHTPTTKTYMNVLLALDEKNIPVTEAKVGESFLLGDAKVEILGPVKDFDDNNNQSVVCKVTFGNKKFLFMGDAETEAETALVESGADLSADVLKVAHHGSETGTKATFLNRVNPRYALITCGEGNSYGHPHDGCLLRLRKVGAAIYRCDVNGTITLLCDGQTITVNTEKGEAS